MHITKNITQKTKNTSKVKKAIIPAAGLGTRFLPATKAQPKEMLPIVDKPTLQYIIEEAIESGIEEILIVTGRNKKSIEDHFDKSPELELELFLKGKHEQLKEVQALTALVDIHYIRQKEPKGLGHAISCAKSFINNEPFAVMLGDDIVDAPTPCLKQLMDAYDKTNTTIVGVQSVSMDDVHKYGIIDGLDSHDNLIKVNSLVEKPLPANAPSNKAIMGRYVLTPEIFDILENVEPGVGQEIQLTDALNSVENIHALNFTGKRYDVGDKIGFLKATIDFALKRSDLRDDLIKHINSLNLK